MCLFLTNMRLHDFLGCEWIRVNTLDGKAYEGFPVNVEYADESESGEDEITLESEEWDGPLFLGIQESDIESIEIIR